MRCPGHTIQYIGYGYKEFVRIVLKLANRDFFTEAEVEVQEWIDGSIHLYYEGKELKIKEVEPKKKAKRVYPEIELELLRKEGKEDLLLVSSY